jgi:hypothetical protein
MKDGNSRTYYGYDVSLEPADEDDTLRVSIQPLSFDAERLELPEPETWTRLPPPRYPGPQTVHLGDTMAFDILVNHATGQKIVEYLHFGERHRRETAIGPAREFTIHDAQLNIRAGRLTVNGEEIEQGSMGDGSVRGHFIIFYLPPNGRFVLSLVPHPEVGLLKAGEVRGSTLSFQAAGDMYEVNCRDKIVPGSAYDLFVLHDPTYRPSHHPNAEFYYGSSSAFEGTR